MKPSRLLKYPVLASLVFCGGRLSAQTWTGAGGDDLWGTSANWSGGAPVPGTSTSITFSGATRLTPNNNYTAFDDFGSINFASGAGAFTLSGSAIDLFGKIENNSSSTQTVNLAIGTGSVTGGFIEMNPVSGNLVIGGSDVFLGNNQLRVWGNNGNTLTFGPSTIISGTGGTFALNQNSTVVFQSAHTYTGDTFINAGRLELASGAGLATSQLQLGDTTGTAAAELRLTSASGGFTSDRGITVRSGSSGTRTISATNTSGTNTLSGNVVLNSAVTLNQSSTGTLALSGVVSGAQAITKTGSGILQLSGSNTFSGALTVQQGTLSIAAINDASANGTLGNSATAVTLGNTGGVTGTLSYTGASASSSKAFALATGGTGAFDVTTSANILTLSGGISGSGALTKSGAGTLAFSTQKTYTGNTTINGGVLDLTGGGGATGTIRGTATVNTGATLRLSSGDATGYNTGSSSLTTINLNGGTLNVNTASNQTLGGAVINMTGGAITGVANSNLDFFQGSSAVNVLTSANQSTIGGTKINMRQNGGITFNVANGAQDVDLLVNSVISNSSGFTTNNLKKSGDGTMQLTAANTFSTAVEVQAGRLWVSGTNGLLSASGVTVSSGATLELGATNIFVGGHGTAMGNTRTIAVNGGTLVMNGNMDSRFGNVTLNNGATWTSNRALTNYDALLADVSTGAATVSVTGTGAATMNGSGGIHLQGVQNFDVADTVAGSGTDLTVSMILASQGSIGGAAGGINKTGAGTMLLSNAGNTFNGNLTVGAGAIVTGTSQGGGTNGYIGVISGGRTLTVNSGATLDFRANNQFGGSGKTAASVPAIVLNGGTLTSTRFNILGNVTLNGGTLTNSTTDTGSYEGYEFLGNVTVGGTSASTISSTNGRANHLRGGSTITFDVADATTSSAADLIVSNPLRNGSGDYTGNGSLLKTGSGTMQLNAANTYSGSTTVSTGTLILNFGSDVGAIGSSAITVESGANLVLNTGDATGYASSALLTLRGTMTKATGNFHDTLNRNVLLDGGTITATDGNATSGGAINLFGNTVTTTTGSTSNINITGSTLQLRTDGASTPVFDVVTNSTLNINAAIDGYLGSDSSPLNKNGGGTMVLLQNNLYNGVTNLNAGTVQVGNGGTTGSLGDGAVNNNGSLVINRGNGYAITNNISGSGSFTQAGSGTTTLSGTTTYTGATQVSAGTLLVNGSIGDSAVTVSPGASLGGSGTIGTGAVLNTVTIDGTLSPGNSPGILTINDNLDLNGSLTLDLLGLNAGSEHDRIILNGAGDLGGTLNPLWGLATPATVNTELILILNDGTDAFTGAFTNAADLAQMQDNLGNFWQVHYSGGDGNDLTLVAVPEPKTMLLGVLGAVSLLRRRRSVR